MRYCTTLGDNTSFTVVCMYNKYVQLLAYIIYYSVMLSLSWLRSSRPHLTHSQQVHSGDDFEDDDDSLDQNHLMMSQDMPLPQIDLQSNSLDGEGFLY